LNFTGSRGLNGGLRVAVWVIVSSRKSFDLIKFQALSPVKPVCQA
jgi:hypothetical protein